MSRMTAAQIISLGEYLEADFDPATLTVSQLLGVLGYHNTPYPTPYTKAKLVNVFNNEVKTRAAKYKKERLKKENSLASEDGIMDGLTGRPLGSKGKEPASIARRSSRRLSHAPADAESSPMRPEAFPEPPKRRRSSAQPNLGGTTRKVVPVPVTVVEVSEEEEEEEILPPKKVSRTNKTTSGASRRVSHISGGEDSGWEDNNIFQSGAESSSPVRPSPVRPRVSRPSIVPRKSRKSTSAPPQLVDSSPIKAENIKDSPRSPLSPLSYKFSPPPPPRFSLVRDFSPIEPSKPEPEESRYESEEEDAEPEGEEPQYEGPEEIEWQQDEYIEAKEEETNRYKESEIDDALARLISEDASIDDTVPAEEEEHTSVLQWIGMVFGWLAIVAVTYTFFSYKVESATIGFCSRGTNTSQALETLLAQRSVLQACTEKSLLQASVNNSSRAEVDTMDDPCPLPPLFPLPHPSSCTPCPDHATCEQFSVTCDSGYLLKPHLLLAFIPVSPSQTTLTTSYAPSLGKLFFQAFSSATSGLPGFGSVGLPPRCLEDPQRKRNIGALGKAVESMLGRERGLRVCRGERINATEPAVGPGAAVKWGVQLNKLKEVFRESASPSILPVFDDMFDEAIQQLSQWGGVFVSETPEGVRYVAHKTPAMTWDCTVLVKARNLWEAWRATVLVSVLSILFVTGLRIRMTQKQKEKRRIAGLVQVALDTLRNQEMAHYTDPLTAPQPYLSSIQLRDLVLQDEHSVNIRRRLWERVEHVVESNANVRANLEEIEGGDETRVWRWVGSAGTGRTPGRKEREVAYDHE